MTNFDVSYGWFDQTYYASPPADDPAGTPSELVPVPPRGVRRAPHRLHARGSGVSLSPRSHAVRRTRRARHVPGVPAERRVSRGQHLGLLRRLRHHVPRRRPHLLLSSIRRTSRLRLALSGVFFAAGVATNLFVALLVAGAVCLYLYTRVRAKGIPALRAVRRGRGCLPRRHRRARRRLWSVRARARRPVSVLHAVDQHRADARAWLRQAPRLRLGHRRAALAHPAVRRSARRTRLEALPPAATQRRRPRLRSRHAGDLPPPRLPGSSSARERSCS